MSAARSPYVVQAPAGISASALAATSHAGSSGSVTSTGPGHSCAIRFARSAARAWICGRPHRACAAISWFMDRPLVASSSRFSANELLLSFGLYPVSVRLASVWTRLW